LKGVLNTGDCTVFLKCHLLFLYLSSECDRTREVQVL